MPGSASSARRTSPRSAPRSSAMVPSASAAQSVTSARPRALGIGRSSGSRAAIVAASGKRWVSSSVGWASGRPWARVSRAATVRAPATLTCWPSTARTAISLPSTWPGTRSPGTASDERADQGVAGERLRHGDRVAVGVEHAAHALDGGGGVAQVVEGERRDHERRLAAAPPRRGSRAGPVRCRAGARACGSTSRRPRPPRPGSPGWRGSRAARSRRTACARRAAW